MGAATGSFKRGDRVLIHSLEKRTDLNGKIGTLGDYDEAAERWAVVLDEGGGAKIKSDNLQLEEEQKDDAKDDEDDPSFPWDEGKHRALLPPDGEFNVEELSKWNGVDLPMCLGVCGRVVDVSSSSNFRPSHGYGKLWGGRDCTLAMAKTSLKAEDANIFDWKLDDLDEGSFNALVGWYKHYVSKYPVVGKLCEYDGWDFSRVLDAAKDAELPAYSK